MMKTKTTTNVTLDAALSDVALWDLFQTADALREAARLQALQGKSRWSHASRREAHAVGRIAFCAHLRTVLGPLLTQTQQTRDALDKVDAEARRRIVSDLTSDIYSLRAKLTQAEAQRDHYRREVDRLQSGQQPNV